MKVTGFLSHTLFSVTVLFRYTKNIKIRSLKYILVLPLFLMNQEALASDPPVADIFYDCAGSGQVRCSFYNASTDSDGQIISYHWIIGPYERTGSNAVVDLPEAGTYTAQLTVTDNDGFTDTIVQEFEVGMPKSPGVPDVDFGVHCNKLSCSFTNYSYSYNSNIVQFLWRFSDNNIVSAEVNPIHHYPYSKQAYVYLYAKDENGNVSRKIRTIRFSDTEDLPPPPNEAPHIRLLANCEDLTCTFNAENSYDVDGQIIDYFFNFGANKEQKGPSSTAQHTFSAPGAYGVRLTVTDDDGAIESVGTTVTVDGEPPPPPPPNVHPTPDFSYICSNLTCEFTDLSSDSDGYITRHSWSFGDGSSSTLANPIKTYNAAGTYTVSLKVTDDDGSYYYKNKSVTVTTETDPPPNQPPSAGFVKNCSNLSCSFTSTSTDGDGSIASSNWNLGDGSNKSGNVINHTYAAAGTYTVTLTVTDNDGASDSASVQVTATEPPPPVDEPPTVSITSPSDGEIVSGHVTINASASDDNSVVSVRFFINNLEIYTDNLAPFSYTFNSAQYANGSLNLKAVAYDGANQSDQSSINITVDNAPEPPADNEAPVVNITSPSDSAIVSGGSNLTLAASASDNVAVSYVRFYVDGSLICTDSSPSYACSWKMPKAKGKSYRIEAHAFDAAGNSSSDVINISSSGSKGGGGNGGGGSSGGDKPCRGKKCQ